MNSITSAEKIRIHLEKDKYAKISGDKLVISSDLLEAKQQFLDDWPNLEPDKYLKDGSRFRFRRFNYFHFAPQDGGIKPFPAMPYHQSSKYNAYAGDVQRHFTSFTDSAKNNPFLHALIQFNFNQLPVSPEKKAGPWKVESHQLRVVTNPEEVGEPTPEGIHRDGVDFVFIYLIKRENIIGGESIIHDDDGNLLEYCTLTNPFDAIVVWDPKVLHGANSIHREDNTKTGFRDVLLVGFTHEPDLEPPQCQQ